MKYNKIYEVKIDGDTRMNIGVADYKVFDGDMSIVKREGKDIVVTIRKSPYGEHSRSQTAILPVNEIDNIINALKKARKEVLSNNLDKLLDGLKRDNN